MNIPQLPKNVERLTDEQPFSFACHNKVRCFTHCCRHLELSLTPYDVLRLKNGLKISSTQFLEQYVIIEQEEHDIFPRLYLTMIDDGNASCIFVNTAGCSVYQDRPGACRAYPMGRASMRRRDNTIEQFFVLLHENHCKGFEEKPTQTPLEYSKEQGLNKYNAYNDAMVGILQHDKIRDKMQLSPEQSQEFILALYDLDKFRERVFSDKINASPLSDKQKDALLDDEKLLLFAIDWLTERLFL